MSKAPDGVGGPLTPIGPTDTVRIVTNDFMFTGGDGYTVFLQATDVQQPGDDLLQVAIDYVGPTHRSPRSSTAASPGSSASDLRPFEVERFRVSARRSSGHATSARRRSP